MKLLTRNFRGLENSQGVQSFHDLLRKEDLDVVFIQKSKVTANFFASRKFSLGFARCLAIDCMGKGGFGPFVEAKSKC